MLSLINKVDPCIASIVYFVRDAKLRFPTSTTRCHKKLFVHVRALALVLANGICWGILASKHKTSPLLWLPILKFLQLCYSTLLYVRVYYSTIV